MNPFTYLLNELEKDNSTQEYAMCLRYLLPYWAERWDDDPQSYDNGYQVVADEVSLLPDSSLKERMLRFVTDLASHRGVAGLGPTY